MINSLPRRKSIADVCSMVCGCVCPAGGGVCWAMCSAGGVIDCVFWAMDKTKTIAY
jgi:hypothetical protein